MQTSDRVHILEDRSLRLENVGLDDMGEYTCEADNAVGQVISTGNLIVYGKLNQNDIYILFPSSSFLNKIICSI